MNKVTYMGTYFPWRPLLIILAIALIGRVLLLASGAVSFHSDEAIVALMARHIMAGERPTFFYGQAYMGSLDSWLVSIGFRLLDESVLTIRIVQSLLYLLMVAVGYAVAWQFSRSRVTAPVAGLVLAVPTPLLAVYTTATLGGYNEVLLLGALILLFGHRAITSDAQAQWLSWLLLGLCAGVGWWVNGLILVYLLPVSVVGLYTLVRRALTRQNLASDLSGIALAAVGFIVGSAPWWVYDFANNHRALQFYLTGAQSSGFGGAVQTPIEKLLGLGLFGFPALAGLRFPWSTAYFAPILGLVVLAIYIAAVYRLARANSLQPGARPLLLSMLMIFVLLFAFSSFGSDPTGRYLLPLTLPLAIALGALVDSAGKLEPTSENSSLRAHRRVPLQIGLTLLVVGYAAAGQITAAREPTGLTTQFTYESHIPNNHDQALITFLDEHQLYHGYTHYWVAFRLAFLSGERMRYSPALPYRADLTYNPGDDRYPAYTEATQNAERIAYITTDRLPEYDEVLQAEFDAQGVTYQMETLGPFRVYYDFSPPHPDPIQ